MSGDSLRRKECVWLGLRGDPSRLSTCGPLGGIGHEANDVDHTPGRPVAPIAVAFALIGLTLCIAGCREHSSERSGEALTPPKESRVAIDREPVRKTPATKALATEALATEAQATEAQATETPAVESLAVGARPGGAPRVDAPGTDLDRVEPGTLLAESEFKQTLAATGARFVVIQVYMEACGPCMTEALHLTEIEEQWQSSGVAILGLGMDDTPSGPKTFDRHTGGRITYPLYLAPWFAEKNEVFATPTMFVYQTDGAQLFRTDPEVAENGVMVAIGEKLAQLLRE